MSMIKTKFNEIKTTQASSLILEINNNKLKSFDILTRDKNVIRNYSN